MGVEVAQRSDAPERQKDRQTGNYMMSRYVVFTTLITVMHPIYY